VSSAPAVVGDEREVPAPIGRTLRIARPAAGRLMLATLLGAGAIGAAIGLMGTSAWLISRSAQHPSESVIALAIVSVQVFGLSRGFFRYGERLVGHDAAFRALAELRVQVYQRLERLAPAGLPAFHSGDLLARFVGDVDSLQDLMLRVVPPFGIAGVVGAATVGFMWWILPGAGLILMLALLAAATIVPWLTGWLARRSESRQAGLRGELAASVIDLVEGAPELVVYGVAGAQAQKIRAIDAELTAAGAASARTSGIGLGLATLFAGLATWGAVVVGIPAVRAGRLSGVLLAVIALVPMAAFELVVGLPVATQALQRTRRSAARVFDVIDAPLPVTDPEAPLPLPPPPYELGAHGVWARYPRAPAPALRGVDLELRSGRRVAVVGPSGAGKSTVAAVMLRFLDYEAGAIRIDETDQDRLAGDALRTVVGLVGQDAHLFDTSLAENLRIGRRSATDADLASALAGVGLAGWLDELAAGLATEVGRYGSRLSGGQRQRVVVARALLAEFPILVLDEPAEHLDPRGADAMTTDLLRLTDGRSTLFITHRLAGLESVDEVLVVDDGTVVERGSHDGLLQAGGRYSQLWWDEMKTERRVLSNEERSGSGGPALLPGDGATE
jgi:thiol reductant ABC exporter CydC subunit